MKKNITIIFLTTAMIFLKIFLFAQNSNYVEKNRKIDSLLYVLKISKVDTTRVNTYDNLCKAFQLSNPNTALYFGTIGLNLAIDINFKKGMAQLYNNIGIIHTYKGNFEKAIEFYFKYLKICEELGDKGGLADSYNNIGIIYKNKGDYDLAIDYYFKSLKIREFINDKKGMATSYGNIGILYKNKGNYDKSLEFNIKSYKIYEELGDKKGLSISFVNIGIVYYYKGEYDKALESYFKSTIIQENLGEKKGLAETFNNIGIIYKIKGEFDKALEFYLKSLKIKIEIDAKNGIASTYNNIGELYLDQGLSPLTPIAKRVNLINEAKKQQLLSLKIAKEIGAKEMMYYAYESLAQCESALGNYKEAYDYHVLYSQIHDSVFTKESDEKIAEMSARYDSEKKQLQIEKLGKEKKFIAIEKIKDHPEITCVLMDLHMPGIDGCETTERIKKIKKDLPVFAVTAAKMESLKEKAFKAGCNEFFLKPVDREKLYDIILKYEDDK